MLAAIAALFWATRGADRWWEDLDSPFPEGDYLTLGCLCARGFRSADEQCWCGWFR